LVFLLRKFNDEKTLIGILAGYPAPSKYLPDHSSLAGEFRMHETICSASHVHEEVFDDFL